MASPELHGSAAPCLQGSPGPSCSSLASVPAPHLPLLLLLASSVLRGVAGISITEDQQGETSAALCLGLGCDLGSGR